MPAKELSNKLKTLPRSPGVYFHKSKNGEIIYVGKAAVLKNRVRQYFQNNKDFDLKTQALVAEIADTVIRVKNGKIESVTANQNPKKIEEVSW